MDKRENEYTEGLDYVTASDYDVEAEDLPSDDYGDDFTFQTGENHEGYLYNDNFENVSERIYSSNYNPRNKPPKKKKTNSTFVIVLVTVSIICVIFAVFLALTQCTGGKSVLKPVTPPSTYVTTAKDLTEAVVETQPLETALPTDAVAPAETTAQEATTAPTEQVTEPQTQQETTTAEVEETTVGEEQPPEDEEDISEFQ